MVSDDWGGRGESTCAPSFGQQGMSTEVAKFFNAAQLMVNGVSFTRVTTGFAIGESFHGSSLNDSPQGDYGLLSIAESNGFHDWMRHQVVDVLPASTGVEFANFESRSGVGIPNLVQTSCVMYDNPFEFSSGTRLASSDPVFRAVTVIHEAWHAWEQKHGAHINTACGHSFCPQDHLAPPPNPGPPPSGQTFVSSVSCNPGAECDIWYPHPQGACPQDPLGQGACETFGDEGFMSGIFHRPYQAETEFACDVANTPQGWVPLIVRELMASNADFYETNNSVNGTNPLLPATQPACYSLDFGIHYATCGDSASQCDEANPCASGSFCNPQTGCCQSAPPSCSITGRTTCDGVCTCNEATNCCVPAVL
jgi:hypothetical protein